MSDTYTSYDLVEFDKPLVAQQRPMPVPSGTEVLVRVRRSGVCHSDIHIQEGFFDLGEEGKLEMGARHEAAAGAGARVPGRGCRPWPRCRRS